MTSIFKSRHLWSLALGISVLPGCQSAQNSRMGQWFADRNQPQVQMGVQPATPPDGEIIPSSDGKLRNPDKVYLNYARWQEEAGQITEARRGYEVVLAENPKSVPAILGLARLAQQSGDLPGAEDQYQRALKLEPKNADVNNAVGQFYVSTRNWSQAILYFENALRLAPGDRTYEYNLGLAQARSGDLQSAFPHLNRVLGDAGAHYNIGYILYEQNQQTAAIQQFELALSKNPDMQEARQMLAKLRPSAREEQLAVYQSQPPVIHQTSHVPAQEPQPPVTRPSSELRIEPGRPRQPEASVTPQPVAQPAPQPQSVAHPVATAPQLPPRHSVQTSALTEVSVPQPQFEQPRFDAPTQPAATMEPEQWPHQPVQPVPTHPVPTQPSPWRTRK